MTKNILVVLTVIGFFSCSSDDDHISPNLIGKWNWIGSSGGIAGTSNTPESTGNEIKLEISRTTIKSYLNDSLNFTAKYSIETRESILFNDLRKMIILENGVREIIDFNGTNLVLLGDCYDCFASEYEKE